jgi:perosamine synthetase
MTDFQCALGLSQLRKLKKWVERRQEIAQRYQEAFADMLGLDLLGLRDGVSHAYHLYVVRVDLDNLRVNRETFFKAVRHEGIGVNVHYIPVNLHPFYRDRFGTGPGLCPVAETAYERLISLPIYPAMSDTDLDSVIKTVKKVVERYGAD